MMSERLNYIHCYACFHDAFCIDQPLRLGNMPLVLIWVRDIHFGPLIVDALSGSLIPFMLYADFSHV